MTKIIAVCNRKGGVGKTTTAVHLAHGLATKGKKTLIVDLDAQSHVADSLGLLPTKHVFDLLVNDGPIDALITDTGRPCFHALLGDTKTSVAEAVIVAQRAPIGFLRGKLLCVAQAHYDVVVLDTPPSAGELQTQALWGADRVLIPSSTDYLATRGVFNLVSHLRELKRNQGWQGKVIGILPTLYDSVTRESQNTMNDLQNHFGAQLLPLQIHRTTTLREAAAEGKTIFEYAETRKSSTAARAVAEYSRLVELLLPKLL